MVTKKKDVILEEQPIQKKLIAQKAFTIRQNDYLKVIAVGDDISDIPEIYLENLKTEGVL